MPTNIKKGSCKEQNFIENELIKFPGFTKGCEKCMKKISSEEHKCSFWYCKDCKIVMNKQYVKPENHQCGEYKCSICSKLVLPIINENGESKRDRTHKCYIMRNEIPKVGKKYVFFDFETDQSTGTHEVNYCIAKIINEETERFLVITPDWCRRFKLCPNE